MSMTTYQRINLIREEINELFDNIELGALRKMLATRIINDLNEIQDELGDLNDLKLDLKLAREDNERLIRERDELKDRFVKMNAAQLKDTSFYSKLTANEIARLEDNGELEKLLLAMVQNQFINAIKLYRYTFGSGLKEAKDRIEEIMGGFNR